MPDWLQPEVMTVALCWRLQRRDGVAIGLTSHDRDLWRDGLTYRATPGIVPSAIHQKSGMGVDTMEVTGALSSDAVREDDLIAGRWDGAQLLLFAIDWSDPEGEALVMARGELGEVAIKHGSFTAELRGPTSILERPVVELTSPECRAALGDRRCGVDPAGLTVLAQVSAVAAADAFTVTAVPSKPLAYGRVRWMSGANAGLESAVLAANGGQITLREPPPFAVVAGARLELMAGCDKRLVTCRFTYGNVANFRGEPHLPGNDLLTRYPGA
ncbi:DUF2163 domain-containing protein [Aquisediminimonas sediminicola]|uniref:DUF2163 domain-containing protein n=1 Tax=Alteraquisediminimonas sediminicola TaxID=2676787 RepID=UPI001C8DB2BF|nr:DUF2163 domain-containing protein [Aquisediminimonas sediminicola]